MLLLVSATDVLRIVTGSAADVDVHASYVDYNGTVTTPGRSITGAILTATTTTVVAAPGSGVTRNVKGVMIHNTHASQSTLVTVQVFDGTTALDIINCILLADEHLELREDGSWVHRDAALAEYTYSFASTPELGIAGSFGETMPRQLANTSAIVGASGTLYLAAVKLYAGQLVSSITLWSGSPAAATTTNLFFGLYDGNRNKLAESANQGVYTWGANSEKTLAMTTPYRITSTGIYYIGVLQVATTIAALVGAPGKTSATGPASKPPILHGNSTTGLTTSIPGTGIAITTGTVSLWAAVS